MWPGRQARGADIANNLPPPDSAALARYYPAHMAIATGKTATVVEPHKIAIAAIAPSESHNAVGHRKNRLAIACLEIKAGMHPHIAQNRVPSGAKTGCHGTIHRATEGAFRFTDARCLKPLGVAAQRPFQHLNIGFSTTVNASI